jgi:homeodomain-containing protein
MPWNETEPMNERVKFIARYLRKDEPFTVLCEAAGISRKTGYKWVERYEGGGVVALVDRSRAPLSHPHAVPEAVVETIVALRRRHPRWGPRKLLAILMLERVQVRAADAARERPHEHFARSRLRERDVGHDQLPVAHDGGAHGSPPAIPARLRLSGRKVKVCSGHDRSL